MESGAPLPNHDKDSPLLSYQNAQKGALLQRKRLDASSSVKKICRNIPRLHVFNEHPSPVSAFSTLLLNWRAFWDVYGWLRVLTSRSYPEQLTRGKQLLISVQDDPNCLTEPQAVPWKMLFHSWAVHTCTTSVYCVRTVCFWTAGFSWQN